MSKFIHYDIYLLILTPIFFLIPSTTADIRIVTIVNDSRTYVHLRDFCFNGNGRIIVTPYSVLVTSNTTNNFSRQGFLTLPVSQIGKTIEAAEDAGICILDYEGIQRIGTLEDFFSQKKAESFPSRSILVDQSKQHRTYFANCDAENNTNVTMKLRVETYNIDADGERSYIGYGDESLSRVYLEVLFLRLYLPFCAYWVYICYRHKKSTCKIHSLMTILIVMKTLSLLFTAEDKQHLKVRGKHFDWIIFYRSFEAVHGILFTVVTMLLGTGWSFFKNRLQIREEIVLTIGIILKVVLHSIYVSLDQRIPRMPDYISWDIKIMLIEVCTWFLPLITYLWSIRTLRRAARARNAARTLEKLKRLKVMFTVLFLWGFGSFIVKCYLDILGMCGKVTLLSLVWEFITMILLTVLYYAMRPTRRRLHIHDGNFAMAIIRGGEFDNF